MGNDAILPDDKTEHEDPLFSNYTDDEDNWPEKTEPNGNEIKFETPMELKTLKEPVKPVQEIKLEVQKVEPVRTEPVRKEVKQAPLFTVEENLETDKLAEQLVKSKDSMILRST
jgi:hypothetical protein